MDQTPGLTGREFEQSRGTQDWRVLGVDAVAWYAAPSHALGVALARRVVEIIAELMPTTEGSDVTLPDMDVRAGGVRVRLGREGTRFRPETVEAARLVSAAADDLGLSADPTVVQDVQLALDAMEAERVAPFWARILGYERSGDEDLVDPGRRLPPIWLQQQDAPRPLRQRLHLDVVTPQPVAAAALEAVPTLGGAVREHHDYYATVADADGNEADLLPLPKGADGWGPPETADWRLVFSAMACYPTGSTQEALELAEAVAALADEATIPLGIDLRPGLVTLDSGKDRWEMVEGFEQLAARVQRAARDLGLSADVELPRFIQVGIDAVDIPVVRGFWRAVLGYEDDERSDVTDIVDPQRLGIPLFLQDLDAEDTPRREQRNRLHIDLFLPHDQAAARVEAGLAAGGRVVREHPVLGTTLADPESNEVDIAISPGREEHSGW